MTNTMTDTPATNAQIDEAAGVDTPKGFKVITVNAYTSKRGKIIRPHTRIVRDRPHYKRGPYKKSTKHEEKRDPISHRPVRVAPRAIPKHEVSKQRQQYAQQLYEQLNVPLAFFEGMQINNQFDEPGGVVRRCITAIEEARSLINRFTSTHTGTTGESNDQ